MAFLRVRGVVKLKCHMPIMVKCSSICDAIFDRTGVVLGAVLLGMGRGTLERVREKILRW